MIIRLEKSFKSRYGFPVIDAIDPLLFSITYPHSGCNRSCRDVCCSGGAAMDIHTFRNLEKHRNAPEFAGIAWEGYNFEEDIYSPGGRECYTKFDHNRCMFQNADWGCSIHSYCLRKKIDVHELKFFICCIFPVEITKIEEEPHVLTAAYEMRHAEYDLPCKKNGDTSVYEIARKDIEYYYGNELITEIDNIKNMYTAARRAAG